MQQGMLDDTRQMCSSPRPNLSIPSSTVSTTREEWAAVWLPQPIIIHERSTQGAKPNTPTGVAATNTWRQQGQLHSPDPEFRPLTMHSAEWVRNGPISAVIRSQTDHRRCASLHTGTKGQQKLVLGTCAVGAAQWARRGRTSKITETAREARHVAMGKPESTGPVPQAEARGQHMSDHSGPLQRGPTSPQPHHRAGREERRRAEEAGPANKA